MSIESMPILLQLLIDEDSTTPQEVEVIQQLWMRNEKKVERMMHSEPEAALVQLIKTTAMEYEVRLEAHLDYLISTNKADQENFLKGKLAIWDELIPVEE